MKKHYILNRPMFNRGGVSAYGKGIASNLVTEEQRQRFNYGGRVGLKWGSNYMDIDTSGKLYQPDQSMIDFWKGTGVYGSWDALEKAEEEERVAKAIQKDVSEREIGGSPQDRFWEDELNKARFGESDKYTTSSEGIGLIEKLPVVEDEDEGDAKKVMTDSDWMDLLGPTEEQKRRTKGEAQLNLAAGALDVFSQPTIAKGMKAASPHLSKLAQTASADQKARDKAILQGKVLSKVYTDRAGAKGEDVILDKKLATFKEGLKEARGCLGAQTQKGAGGGYFSGGAGVGGHCIHPKYKNFAVYGNVIVLCQGKEPEDSMNNCSKLISLIE